MRNKYVYNKYQELQFLNISVLSGDESLINNHFKTYPSQITSTLYLFPAY
jgi:hypothetical protein